MRSHAWLLVAFLALLLSGCPQADPGGSSPEAVYDRAHEASDDGEWEDYYACYRPESQNLLLFSADVSADRVVNQNADAQDELKKELASIREEHGVEDVPVGALSFADPEKYMAARVSKVSNKAELFEDLMEFVHKHAKKTEKPLKGKLSGEPTLDDDQGVGQTDQGETIYFVRDDDRWYLSVRDPRQKKAAKTAEKTKTE